MKRTRAGLLAVLKGAGYKGEETLDAVKAFIASDAFAEYDGLDLGEETIETVWANVPAEPKAEFKGRKKLAIAADGEPTNKAGAVNADIEENRQRDENTRRGWTPKGAARLAERKVYDRKANAGRTVWGSADEAEAFGAWLRIASLPYVPYGEKLNDEAIVRKTAITTTNTAGGALVPDEFRAVLVDNFEKYGVARQVFGVIPMKSDHVSNARRTSDYTVYAPGEAGSITASDQAFDNIGLTAKKLAALGRVSRELMNDSAFSFGEEAAKSMARAFAKKEDDLFFNGDGTSTYFGFTGIRTALRNVDATITNVAGIYVSIGGNLFNEATVADFTNASGLLPEYAAMDGPQWVMSRTAYFQSYARASQAQGGVTLKETIDGIPRNVVNGEAVHFAQVLPRTNANSTVYALYGNFQRAALLGEVTNGLEIMVSDQRYFDTDEIAIRGIERVAFTVFDVGTTSDAGPVIGLASAAS